MLSLGLGLWSAAQMLGGLVGGFGQFIAVRALLGAGESPLFPTCARVVSDWFHPRERGSATGIWNCSSSLGSAISAPLLTFLMVALGWRWMFIIMGLAGLGVAGAVYWLHRDPGQIPLTATEQLVLSDQRSLAARPTWRDWRALFRFRTTWGMISGFFGAVYLAWLYFAWLPQYLELQWHLSIAKTGWVAMIPFLCGVVGSLAGGRVCDVLLQRGWSPMASRKVPLACSLFGTVVFTGLAAYASSGAIAVACISMAMFLVNCTTSAAWAMVTVATGSNQTASLGSIQNFGGYIGGALAPTITGFIVQRTGSFRLALVTGALIGLAAVIGHLILVKLPIPARATTPLGGCIDLV